jgi:hypothetical protein
MRSSLHESRSLALLSGALILSIVPLAGCTLGAAKQAAAPPPPNPAAVQPPAPEQPLSIPQTAVLLPSPQQLNPDAIPPPVPAAPAAPPVKPDPPVAAQKSHRAATPVKQDPEPEAEPEAPPTAAPVVQEQAPIQPILSGEEQRKIQNAIDGRKHTIAETLNRAKHLSQHDQSQVDRIHSFLAQCEDAEKRGDFSQADALSQRALILSQELQVE